MALRVETLRGLFYKRSREEDYLDRFDCDLRRFLDVEHHCLPIMQRHLTAPETVWLRELVDLSDRVAACVYDFSESLACDHEDCGSLVSVDRIDPPCLGAQPPRVAAKHRAGLPDVRGVVGRMADGTPGDGG